MTRFLPLLMLALGLLLVSATIATASPAQSARDTAAACLLDETARAGADHRPEKLGRCLKSLGLGILVRGCNVQADLPSACRLSVPKDRFGWPSLPLATGFKTVEPICDLPPPRA